MDWSPTQLPPAEEALFQQWIKQLPWYGQFRQQYGEEPDLAGDYDYRGAYLAGVEPAPYEHDQGRFHWPSADPRTGRMLKAPDHPTAWMEEFMRVTGKDPNALGIRTPDEAKAWFQPPLSEVLKRPARQRRWP